MLIFLQIVGSLCVLIVTGFHVFHPDVTIDAIGLSLLVAIGLPWILPHIKTLKFGGAELELREKVDALIEARSEQDAGGAEITTDDQEKTLLGALTNEKYDFRSATAAAKEVKLDKAKVDELLGSLRERGAVRRVHNSQGNELWGITPIGRSASKR